MKQILSVATLCQFMADYQTAHSVAYIWLETKASQPWTRPIVFIGTPDQAGNVTRESNLDFYSVRYTFFPYPTRHLPELSMINLMNDMMSGV